MNETSTKSGEYNSITFLQLFFEIPKHQGHTCRTGVSVTLDIYQHLFRLYANTFAHSFDNTKIGL